MGTYDWGSSARVLQWTVSIPSGASRNTPTLFLLQKPDKLLPDGPLGSHVDLTFPTYCKISVALWTPMRVFQDH